ncbi:MAG: DUF1273 family protein [Ruminococcaceae bacterium]|nr:DUF1273 family protein [Oscillospiraceae bacterium]
MVTENISNTCCFFGNRKINETEELKTQLHEAIESLIINENVSLFLFGSRSEFDKLCLESVTEIKEKYPHIKRIYVRAEYPVITDLYKAYLLESYEDTYFPEKIKDAGKASYVERNYEMIDKSRFCIVYHDENIANSRKSGTKIALDYAFKKGKKIIRFPD